MKCNTLNVIDNFQKIVRIENFPIRLNQNQLPLLFPLSFILPKLKTVAASLNNDLIPRRMPYPSDEQALNSVNYDRAAAATNGNSVNVKTWWDIK